MKQELRIKIIEHIVIIILWTLLYITPLLFGSELNRNWNAIYRIWTECTIILVAFNINRYILMPQLFYKRRYYWYTISILISLILIYIISQYLNHPNEIMDVARTNPHPNPNLNPHLPPRKPQGGPIMPKYANTVILSFLILCFDIGLSISMKWLKLEKHKAELESENNNVKLSLLQNQVSPHFLMNTLNNIHALIDINPKKAQDTTIELSRMMDYLLHETADSRSVSIDKELGFIENYINLMRLRYPSRVLIEFKYNQHNNAKSIPPLLTLNFIENAFKYGVDYAKESYIKINFIFTSTQIEFDILNTNHAVVSKNSRGGLGINNIKNRLNLIYGDNYNLSILNTGNIFHVNLKIPVL